MGKNINVDYKKLKNKASLIESKLYDADGMVALANKLKEEMDIISKIWVDKGHYEHLNAVVKEYTKLKEYIDILEKYRKFLYDASTEFEKARNESVGIANVK